MTWQILPYSLGATITQHFDHHTGSWSESHTWQEHCSACNESTETEMLATEKSVGFTCAHCGAVQVHRFSPEMRKAMTEGGLDERAAAAALHP